MTREEAIKIIDCYDIGFYDLSGEKIPADKLADAFDMAIEALSAEANLTCKTCADRAMCIMSAPDGNWKACKDYKPSAEAVQGEWVRKYDDKINCYWYECDQCGEYRPRNQFGHEYNSNFCPNCGAKMVKGGGSE